MNHRQRLLELQAVLQAHEAFWRPSPFQVRRPAWSDTHPALANAVLGLDEATLERLIADPHAGRAWLAPRLPIAHTLDGLCALQPLSARELPPRDPHAERFIPGRKLAQIDAFAAHGAAITAPVLEWCAGKGHLGRRLARLDGVPLDLLEIDPALCSAAERLADDGAVRQTVICADALNAASRRHVRGRSVVALHACGELHRTLVRHAAHDQAHSYRIAPCCYHLGAAGAYRPVSREATLPLDERTLRLAVTETVTAGRTVRARLARDQAWKLGFLALRNEIEGNPQRSFKPVPTAWLALDFAGYCRALARREGVKLPAAVDWDRWQAIGERRRAEVRRLELVRHAFRRALEVWLVMDLARGLEDAGFAVHAGPFCARTLTPRNLLLIANREG